MKRDKRICSTLLLLLLLSGAAHGFSPGDTIRLKKPAPNNIREKYNYQPIIIKTSPTALLFGGVFPLTAEYRLMFEMTGNRKHADQIAISWLGKSLLVKGYEKLAGQNVFFKINGYRLQYMHKFYLVSRKGYAPYGFYFGPLISYSNAKVSLGLSRYYQNTYYDFHHLNMNVVIGVQMGKKRKRATEIYFGLGYKSNKLNYHLPDHSSIQLDTEEFGPIYNAPINAVFGINVGIAK